MLKVKVITKNGKQLGPNQKVFKITAPAFDLGSIAGSAPTTVRIWNV